jgi:hypothetical protein
VDDHLHLARLELGVHRLGVAVLDLADHGHHHLGAQPLDASTSAGLSSRDRPA